MRRSASVRWWWLAAPLLAGCSAAPTPLANDLNVLSAGVRFVAQDAADARLEWSAGADQGTTAWAPVAAAGATTLWAFGLAPRTAYELTLQTRSEAGLTTTWAPVTVTTGALPDALAGLSLDVRGKPFDGYVLLDLLGAREPGIAAAFDASGRLAWYRLFPGPQQVAELKQTPRGTYTAFVGNNTGYDAVPGSFVELAPSGEVLREWAAPSPEFTDCHELQLLQAGDGDFDALLSGYQARPADLSAIGGSDAGTVVEHVLQRVRPSGEVTFSWAVADHFDLSSWIDPVLPTQRSGTDFDHPNAFELDADGTLAVSLRNFDAVVGLRTSDGAVLWQLGGVKGDLRLGGDPLGGFSGQHSLRLLPGGHLLLYDNGNGHTPRQSRAVEYALDLQARTATLVWEYRHDPPIFTAYLGSATRSADGSTLVGFGLSGVIDRVDADGTQTWEGRLTNGGHAAGFYRAVPIEALDPGP